MTAALDSESISSVHPITTTPELAAACERMAAYPFVTIDTEFLRETTYYPLLCVAQMASADEAVVIDALAPGIDLAPFYALMANEKVMKVFHAARQDIEIIWHAAKLIPHPIFDSQVAAMVLGYGDSISYDQLVAAHHRRYARQVAPLHRLDTAAAVGGATALRDFRCDASARRLSGAGRGPEGPRSRRLGRRRNGRADLARHLPHGTGQRLAAASRPACASRRSLRC